VGPVRKPWRGRTTNSLAIPMHHSGGRNKNFFGLRLGFPETISRSEVQTVRSSLRLGFKDLVEAAGGA